MKPLSTVVFILCLYIYEAQKGKLSKIPETYLIEECVNNSYTQNSCAKVFCQPWQRCLGGTCFCKLPYQCPKNGTSVCSTERNVFRTYCQLKSFECQHDSSKFMNKGSCNNQDNFQISLMPENASQGFIQVKINHNPRTFLCGKALSMNEANVACRHLGFPRGASDLELHEPDDTMNSTECIRATCRGLETSLAECTLTSIVAANRKFAKVMCNSENKACTSREFRCVNGKCILSSRTCNGINDCGDLSDELCCKACRAKSFHCNSDVCIPRSDLCNKERDCLTGEDESQSQCGERTQNAVPSMDEERRNIKTFLPKLHCGVANHTVTRQKRIVGGKTAKLEESPWQVAIKGERGTVNCGGVYIGGCWILTAAHCVRASRVNIYKIFAGMLDTVTLEVESTLIEAFSLNKVIVHEDYNSRTYENDIALLEMKRTQVCRLPRTVAACIPWSPYMFKTGHQCKVSGWGLTEDTRRQFTLKWGYVHLMANCSEIYGERFLKGMECAGTSDGSVDSCRGDSGGPLICFDANNVAYVWGIVSWGENCGDKGHPGVYTKVADYFEWIAHHTGRSLISQYNV